MVRLIGAVSEALSPRALGFGLGNAVLHKVQQDCVVI